MLKPAAIAPVLLGACLALLGCAAAPAEGCRPGEARREVAQLVFGRNIGAVLGVSDQDFEAFLDQEVSPRFPDGLTVSDSQGRWLNRGVLEREPGKTVMILLPGHADDHRKLGEVAAAYEARFHQGAVLSLVRPACTSFWPVKPG